MKLTFAFTENPDINSLSKDDIFTTSFEIPNDATHLIGYEERILVIANLIGHFTDAVLHFSCSELGIKNQIVKREITHGDKHNLYLEIKTFILYFEHGGARRQQRQLKILLPSTFPLPQPYVVRRGKGRERKSLRRNLIPLGTGWCKAEHDFVYANTIQTLADQILVLLNSEPASPSHQQWSCAGFHPWWTDAGLITRHNKLSSRLLKEQRQRERQEKKRAERESKLIVQDRPDSILRTGAGRRPGAIPGIFKGVQFRSQLEIRFATELESRQIRWVYEAERLSDGNYLVDFYLPDRKCWVEVKGTFEPRDNYLLKEVAGYLKRERNERLLVYTQNKCFSVSESSFKELSRNSFWEKLTS